MKLFIDDVRIPPDETWDIARNYNEAIDKLSNRNYDEVSFDHDIASYDADGKEKTGYDIAVWLAERKNDGLYVPTTYYVHSMNGVGRARIIGVITRYLENHEI